MKGLFIPGAKITDKTYRIVIDPDGKSWREIDIGFGDINLAPLGMAVEIDIGEDNIELVEEA